MGKRRGDYLGGSSIFRPVRPKGAKDRTERDYVAPPMTPDEIAETERLRAELMAGPQPGLITKDEMRAIKARKRRRF